jgi:hypothetical protein
VRAEVAERERAEQCVADRMQQHVRVGVARETARVRHGDAADDERRPRPSACTS